MAADVTLTDLWSLVPGTRGYRVDPSTLFAWHNETRNSA